MVDESVRIGLGFDVDSSGLDQAARKVTDTAKSMRTGMFAGIEGPARGAAEALRDVGKRAEESVGNQASSAFAKAASAASSFMSGVFGGATVLAIDKLGGAIKSAVFEAPRMAASLDEVLMRVQMATKAPIEQMATMKVVVNDMAEFTGQRAQDIAGNFLKTFNLLGTSFADTVKIFPVLQKYQYTTGVGFETMLTQARIAVKDFNVPLEKVPETLSKWYTATKGVEQQFTSALPGMSAALRTLNLNSAESSVQIAAMFGTMVKEGGKSASEVQSIMTNLFNAMSDTSKNLFAVSQDALKRNNGDVIAAMKDIHNFLDKNGALSGTAQGRSFARSLGLDEATVDMIKRSGTFLGTMGEQAKKASEGIKELDEQSRKLSAGQQVLLNKLDTDWTRFYTNIGRSVGTMKWLVDTVAGLADFTESGETIKKKGLSSGPDAVKYMRMKMYKSRGIKVDEEEFQKLKEKVDPDVPPSTIVPTAPKLELSPPSGSYGYGKGPHIEKQSLIIEEDTKATKGNTDAINRLNDILLRGAGGGGGGGGGVMNASYGPGGGSIPGGGLFTGGGGNAIGGRAGSMSEAERMTGGGGGGRRRGGGGGGEGDEGSGASPSQGPGAPTSAGKRARIAQAKAAMKDQLRREGVPEEHLEEASNLLTGQALAESQLNPSASHDSGTGYGIYGARAERRSKMLNWLKANGYAHNSLEGQAKYMAHEAMSGRYPKTRRALMGANSANRSGNAATITGEFEAPRIRNNRTGHTNEAAGVAAAPAGDRSSATMSAPEISPRISEHALEQHRQMRQEMERPVNINYQQPMRQLEPDRRRIARVQGRQQANDTLHSMMAGSFADIGPVA